MPSALLTLRNKRSHAGRGSLRRLISVALLSMLVASGCAFEGDALDADALDADWASEPGADDDIAERSAESRATGTANDMSTPTAWRWYTNISYSTLKSRIADGYRLVDLEIVSLSPRRYAVSMVRNTGAYARSWWWYTSLSSTELKNKLSDNQARLTDLQVYFENGQKRYAAVMIRNTGADATAWWYYTDRTISQLRQKVTDNGARLIDIDTYLVNGQRRYSGVMVRNTGAQYRQSYILTGASLSTIKSYTNSFNAKVVDIERERSGRYAAILERGGSEFSWFYLNRTYQQVKELVAQHGARIADIERTGSRYDVVLVDNLNELSGDMRELMRSMRDDGKFGFQLRRVGGSTLAGLRTTTPFYPASTVKILHHVHAMRWVQAGGLARLNTAVASSGCTEGVQSAPFATLGTRLSQMMIPSSNSDTNAIQERFGRAAINATAHGVGGMSDATQLQHRLGCGGKSNDPANSGTTRDFTTLYGRLATGALVNGATMPALRARMLNEGNSGWLWPAVNSEAASLGLTAAQRNAFNADFAFLTKAGNVSTAFSIAGWLELPRRNSRCSVTIEDYTFSLFFDDVTTLDAGALGTATNELVRELIRGALATYARC